MRLATLKSNQAILLSDGGAVALSELGFDGSLLELIQSESLQLPTLATSAVAKPTRAYEASDLAAPLQQPSKIIAIGLNYVDHASETKLELPSTPLVFAKFPNSLTGPTDPICIPQAITTQVDYEVELGVIIGRKAKNVAKRDALEHVFGYTVINDVSARDLQFGDKQWVRGKSLDTFCPMGPTIVTKDEVPDPQALRLGCAINGTTLQEASTKDMIFGVADLIERLSHWFTLEPGDIIASGTPSGVGFTRQPPIYLQPGDEVRTWVEGLGELVNPVMAV